MAYHNNGWPEGQQVGNSPAKEVGNPVEKDNNGWPEGQQVELTLSLCPRSRA